MFCPQCGTQLPNDASFCPECGAAIAQLGAQSKEIQREAADAGSGFDTKYLKENSDNVGSNLLSKAVKLLARHRVLAIVCIVAVVVACAVVFGLRESNEKALSFDVPMSVYETSQPKIIEYYDSVMPVSYDKGGYMLGCNHEDFSITPSDNSNTFSMTGEIIVTDLSEGNANRAEYVVTVNGTVATNFMRNQWEASWGYNFETPQLNELNGYLSVTVFELFNAYSSNGVSANAKYGNQWLNVTGEISDMYTSSSGDIAYVVLEYYSSSGYSFDVFRTSFALDSSDPNLGALQVGQVITLTGYLPGGYSGMNSLQFESGTIYGGDYSDPLGSQVSEAQDWSGYYYLSDNDLIIIEKAAGNNANAYDIYTYDFAKYGVVLDSNNAFELSITNEDTFGYGSGHMTIFVGVTSGGRYLEVTTDVGILAWMNGYWLENY